MQDFWQSQSSDFWRCCRLSLFGIVLLFVARPVFGQTGSVSDRLHGDRRIDRLRSTAWGPYDGLPSDEVFDVLQTQDGYLWIGTGAGLARFDGVKFTTFDRGNSPALSTGEVTRLFESSDGTLWVGFDQVGLVALQAGRLRKSTTVREFSDKSIRSILQDRSGALWVGTDSGTWRSSANDAFIQIKNAPQQIMSLAEDRDGQLWMGGPDGLYRWDNESSTAVKVELSLPTGTKTGVNVLVADRDGSLWVGTNLSGLVHFDGEVLDRVLPNASIQLVYQDRLGVIWYAGKSGKLKQWRDGDIEKGNPPWFGVGVNCMIDDREGSLWLGSIDSPHCLRQLRDASAVSFDHVAACVHPASDGGVWLGSYAGLTHAAPHGGSQTLSIDHFKPRVRAYSLAVGSDESLWIASRASWIDHWSGGRLSSYKLRDGLLKDAVAGVYEDKEGTVWISYLSGGVSKRDVNRFREVETFAELQVYWFAEDSLGDLYIGTSDGLYRGTQRVRDPVLEELSCTEFRSHYIDDEGDLWLGMFGGGLCRLRDGQFTNWRRTDGLLSDRIIAITDDLNGNLWLGAFDKVFHVPKASLEGFAADRIDRLDCRLMPLSIEGQRLGAGNPKMARSKDGSVWITRKRDTVKVPPGAIDIIREPAPVHIERLIVDGVDLTGADVVELRTGTRRMEIHYTVATHAQPDAARFRYRLTGYSDDWIEAGAQRVAHFTELPPGSYQFEVLASSGYGIWSEQGASLAMVVHPRWFERSWFKIALALGLCAAVIATVRLYTSTVRHTNTQLQKEISERKQAEEILQKHQVRLKSLASELTVAEERERRRIAADLHDDVGQTLALARIQLASARKSMNSPVLDDKLDTLSSTILKASQDTRHLVYDLSSPSLSELGLNEAIEEWLEEEIGNRYGLRTRSIHHGSSAVLDHGISDDVNALLFRSVRELLINVVKHAKADCVVVTTVHTDDQIKITVEDDGVGFDVKAESFRASAEGGFGLFSIQERMLNLGGSIEIDSEPDKGCRVALNVPFDDSGNDATDLGSRR